MKKMGLPMQMGIGMVLGILVGLLASNMGWSASYFQPFGQLFINLIRMVVVPLVFVTLVAGAASVGDVRSLGRIATKTLVYYLVTTAIAIIIGLILANIVQPGVGLDLSKDNLKAVIRVMQYIYENIMYAELNTKSDYCQVCGYDGEIQIVEDDGKLVWECPNCHNRDQEKMNVARRTCGYIGTQFWNQGRTEEIRDRVLHL